MMYNVVRIVSTNDVNGNPRRGWLVSSANIQSHTFFVNEGYEGTHALKKAINNSSYNEIAYINVQPREFNNLKKIYH